MPPDPSDSEGTVSAAGPGGLRNGGTEGSARRLHFLTPGDFVNPAILMQSDERRIAQIFPTYHTYIIAHSIGNVKHFFMRYSLLVRYIHTERAKNICRTKRLTYPPIALNAGLGCCQVVSSSARFPTPYARELLYSLPAFQE
jgi:hypothetical protein